MVYYRFSLQTTLTALTAEVLGDGSGAVANPLVPQPARERRLQRASERSQVQYANYNYDHVQNLVDGVECHTSRFCLISSLGFSKVAQRCISGVFWLKPSLCLQLGHNLRRSRVGFPIQGDTLRWVLAGCKMHIFRSSLFYILAIPCALLSAFVVFIFQQRASCAHNACFLLAFGRRRQF